MSLRSLPAMQPIPDEQVRMWPRGMMSLTLHRIIAACLHAALSAMVLSCVTFLWFAAAELAPVFEGSFIPDLFVMFGRPLAVALLAVAALQMVAAIAVVRGRKWGRIVLACFSIALLAMFPVGTAIGAYALWALLRQQDMHAGPRSLRIERTSAAGALRGERGNGGQFECESGVMPIRDPILVDAPLR